MYARVAGADFKRNISSVISSTAKVLLNFKVKGDELHVQVLGNLITETTVPILEKDRDEAVDITIQAKLALTLIDRDQDVYIEFQKELVVITQTQFEFQATREWENRYNIPEFDESSAKEINREEFDSLIRCSKVLDPIARETKQQQSDITFHKSKAYISYSGEILIIKTSIDDTFAITAETARNINSILDNKSKYCLNLEKGYIIVKSKYKVIYATAMRANVHMVEAIVNVQKETRVVGSINVVPMSEKIEALNRIYKNSKVTLSISKDDFSISVTDGKTTFAYGSRQQNIISIRFTILHMQAINKLYKETESVEVRAGGTILCLTNNMVRLLVSGTLF